MSQDSIKRRREERLRQLREQMKERSIHQEYEEEAWEYQPIMREKAAASSYMRTREAYWDDDLSDEQESSLQSTGVSFVLKMMVSLFILSFTYVIYHVPLPFSDSAKQFTHQVMTRDFNFQGMLTQVDRITGGSLAILPVFQNGSSEGLQPAWNQTSSPEFMIPVEGAITRPFLMDGQGIEISSSDGKVKSIAKGWVVFVGQQDGVGETVIIQHENGTKSQYSGIGQITVVQQDWVESGQIIAHAVQGKSVYFSLQIQDQYVDPMSVIDFE